MNKKCPNCKLVNYADAEICARCRSTLGGSAFLASNSSLLKSVFVRRALVCLLVVAVVIVGFYVSLVLTAKPLSYDQRKSVESAISILEEKGFSDEVLLLKYLAVFRSNDNWLNASVEKENAYAATNFPFEIMTLYEDFFTYPADEVERAAILLHEAKHLQGKDEKEAYEFVWKNRKKLGWVRSKYQSSIIWNDVRKQTKEYAPHLFVCDVNPFGDCTE